MAFRRSVLVPSVVVALGALFAGCSSGPGTIPQAEIEEKAATQLQKQVGAEEPPTITCPGKMEATVGETMECELSVEGDDLVLPVHVEVTEVKDGKYKMAFEVGEVPEDETTDDTTDDTTEDTTEDTEPADETTETTEQ